MPEDAEKEEKMELTVLMVNQVLQETRKTWDLDPTDHPVTLADQVPEEIPAHKDLPDPPEVLGLMGMLVTASTDEMGVLVTEVTPDDLDFLEPVERRETMVHRARLLLPPSLDSPELPDVMEGMEPLEGKDTLEILVGPETEVPLAMPVRMELQESLDLTDPPDYLVGMDITVALATRPMGIPENPEPEESRELQDPMEHPDSMEALDRLEEME